MSNIATTIEQSKRLLVLGLDIKSADMCLCKTAQDTWFLWAGTPGEYDAHTVPAWSLPALLEVMPKVIVHDMDKHVLCLKYAEGVAPFIYYVVESGRNKGKLIRFNNGRCVPDAYDALDAAYKMVCWLLEQGLIKKGDNDE